MKLVFSLSWCAIASLWYIADRTMHGGFDMRELAIWAGSATIAAIFSARHGRSSPPLDPDTARGSAYFFGGLLGLLLALVATLVELLLRTRPEGSTVALMTALLVHWSAALLAGVTVACGYALRPHAAPVELASV